MKKGNYIFTNKKHSPRSIMSTVLGGISVFAILFCVHLSFFSKGAPNPRHGAALFLSLVFSFIGIILAIWGRMERDRFYIFSYIGLGLNLIAIGLISAILYAGALL